ncbi:unnamed protein product [Alopecurus aequalis]
MDSWAPVGALCVAMPELHSHSTTPLATVRQVLDRGVRSCFVPRLSSTAARQLQQLAWLVDAVHLSAQVDARSLPLCAAADGRFQTGKLYRLCTGGCELSPHHSFIWKNSAPSKVKFFAWLLVQGRIQSRSNLLHKKILRADESGCPICNAELETPAHIVYGCPFARRFWSEIGAHGGANWAVGDSGTCPLPITAPSRSADTLRLLCLWHLWKHRNKVAFDGLTPSLPSIRKNCRDDAVLWRARLPEAARSDVDIWLTYFPVI